MAIILDIKKPTCCYNCPCYNGNDGYSSCGATEKDVGNGNIRQEWCPIEGEIYLSSEKPFEEHEFKVFDNSTFSRNNTIISEDALKCQDGKHVPLKYGSGKDGIVIGDAELSVRGNGMSMSISEETYANLAKIMMEDK